VETNRPTIGRRPTRLARALAVALLGTAVVAASCTRPPGATGGSWTMSGYDAKNTRFAAGETTISAANADQLKPKWAIDTKGDVSATPAVRDGVVYFPDFGGYLNAVDARTGQQIWQKKVSDATGFADSQVRNTPAFYNDLLIVGEIKHHSHGEEPGEEPGGDDHHGSGGGDHHGSPPTTVPGGEDHDDPNAVGHPVHVMAFDVKTGNLVWKTAVDQHASSIITSNPVISGTRIVVGVSSSEEDKAESSDYKCCSFRGSLVSLSARTGQQLWKTYTVPPNPTDKRCTSFDSASQDFKGCADSGVAVWNTPAIDAARNTAYFATGNNYTVTDAEFECAKKAKEANTSNADCPGAGNLIESIIAVDLLTGRIKWAKKLGGFDAWNYQCIYNPGATWCPGPYGNDYDFGSNTNLFTATIHGARHDIVGVGQKSGIYWALDANTGEVIWNTLVGPGSFLGGIEWGTAYDGKYVYVGNGNLSGVVHTLQPSGQSHNGGSWTALDPATGKIVWQTPSTGAKPNGALGPVTVANGVVFGGAISPSGDNMFAMEAATGKPIWHFAAGGSVNGGPAVVDGVVYWGAGYSHFAAVGMTGAQKLYAFSLNGQ
jgi:polyvinyl alcohol dehydrogenase (cytochrome)